MLFLFTTYVTTEGEPSIFIENFTRSIVFIGVAAVVSRIAILLREDNLKYKNLMDSSGASSAVLDRTGKIIHSNSAFEKITGYTTKELKRKNWASIFESESRGNALLIYYNSIEGKGEESQHEELKIKSRNGNEYYVLTTIKHIPELDITLISLVDITGKKKTERMVAVQKERYKKLFQQSTDGVIIHNTRGEIFNANAEALRITGMSLDELKKGNLRSVIPNEQHKIYDEAVKQLERSKKVNYEIRVDSDKYGSLDLDLRSVMIDPGTKVVQTIARDITDRRKDERALAMASKKLNLLSSITRHDILNHIMVARINLEFAKEDLQDQSVRSFLDKSLLAISTIQHQIEFSRDYQEMGGQPPKWHNLDKIVNSCILSLPVPREIRIENTASNVEIYADPMLNKVICNLIGNTIMHGGDVNRISIRIKEEDHHYKLIYSDDGKGIPEKDKENIFKPGYGRNQGFGLYLVKEILSITGASICETGMENRGARFEILFPAYDVRFERPEEQQEIG